jgi:hypothetical protein
VGHSRRRGRGDKGEASPLEPIRGEPRRPASASLNLAGMPKLAMIALMAAAQASCVGGEAGRPPASTQPSTSGQPTRTCASLTEGDIENVASIRPSKQEALANVPESDVRCSTVFIDESGHLILQLTEAGGGRASLKALRSEMASTFGQDAIRELPTLGGSAFVARRVLGFVREGQLVTLQTGYSADGRLELTPDQLARLAEIVESADAPSSTG